MTYNRGTIVYGDDPFKGPEMARPWLVLNTAEMPFHGDQYICLTLSTKTWYDERIPIDDTDMVNGGLPDESAILPWSVMAIDAAAIDRELGTLDEAVVDDAVATLVSYLGLY
ncbi:growth inhibitor [Natrinema sp. CBA1119]|uniref:type II toxin-antitoxin system PemK/MazF family toxin n=1 Tax=Natrinema sp. CBA1119 TaxID=1608465 RepID=UPI000BF6DFA7|nr:type II toxin-antitoxin system PemK/MazF family toxin [Natrinema sp. CBA1119]PGF17085.1 growth inhibitor [Natrinema sp. CBA1119]